MISFPYKHWLSIFKSPTEILLEYLVFREIKNRIRRQYPNQDPVQFYKKVYFEICDDPNFSNEALMARYNLPKYEGYYTLSSEDWVRYLELNSFKKTRVEANKFLGENKIKKIHEI